MPALNIMAIQASVSNSGSSSSAPSRIRPNRVAAITTASTRNASAATTKNQPKVPTVQARPDSPKRASEPLASTPHSTTATTPATPTPSTTRSTGWVAGRCPIRPVMPSSWADRPYRRAGTPQDAGQAATVAASSASTAAFQAGLVDRQPSSSMPRRQ